MKELRVALFTGNYNHIRDGVSLTLNRLVKFLEDQGISVLVFGPSIDNPPIDHVGELVITPSMPMLIGGRKEYRFTTSLPDSVKEKIKAFNPDIIHIATPDRLGFLASNWADENNVPLVGSYHTHFASYISYYWYLAPIKKMILWLTKRFYKRVAQIYVPSKSMIEELDKLGIEGEKRIWARGINLELFNPKKRDLEWRRKVGFNDDDIVVTFVSRLVWEKELATFVKSVNRLQETNSKIRAMVVGSGPAKKEVEELMPEAHFTGFVQGEELARAYASSDVFLFPSHTETFGNVTLEAMASGLPCLVADAIGSKSLVDDGVNGRLGKKQDLEDFIEKLEWLVSDEKRMKEMGEKSREMALEYNWDDINSGLVDNYREVIKNHNSN